MLGFSGNRTWVYAQSVHGRFQKIHRVSGILLHAVLFVTPWIPIGGHPALHIDLPARRIFLLGQTYNAGDTFLLLLVLLLAAFSLFFFTSLFGRLWCGYVCPQTVFLEEWIRPIERLIEGDRNARMRDDGKAWTASRLARRVVKLGLFAGVAFLISMAAMSFFAGAPELWTLQGGSVEYGLVGIMSLGLFADFAWFREQLCIYLCPYARFQSALTDDESLVVMYDPKKGEPRGKEGVTTGGCVDCKKCVVVCPQGIDIRDGFQLECITCGRCIDACEDVMHKLGHEPLVRYGTEAELRGGKTRIIRPRTVVYASLLTGLAAVLLVSLTGREAFQATINRAPGSLYTVDGDGMIRNTFLLKVTNNDDVTRPLEVRVDGLPDAVVTVAPIELAPTETAMVPVVVRMPVHAEGGRTWPMTVHVGAPGGDGDDLALETTFKTQDE